MPRYRALARLYVRKLITAGEEFESDLPPGRNWEPLDDEARAAVEHFRETNGKVLEIADRLNPSPRAPAAVEIPDDWRTLSGPKRRFLAQKLGAQSNVKEADANSYIESELERRAHKIA
jgi:hypothetical protein